jgi:hypothetical protein
MPRFPKWFYINMKLSQHVKEETVALNYLKYLEHRGNSAL